MSLKSFFGIGTEQGVVEFAVEYCAPHWIVVIRNPGETRWSPLRSRTKKVTIQDEFGDVKGTRPAIESFETQVDADLWCETNMRKGVEVHRNGSQRNKDDAWFTNQDAEGQAEGLRYSSNIAS